MSHRVSINSKITDASAAQAALNAKGWQFTKNGNSIHVSSGPLRGASINLTTGEVVCDTDYHRRGLDSLGALNQAYAEEFLKADITSRGGWVEERTVQKDGTIRMVATVSFA